MHRVGTKRPLLIMTAKHTRLNPYIPLEIRCHFCSLYYTNPHGIQAVPGLWARLHLGLCRNVESWQRRGDRCI